MRPLEGVTAGSLGIVTGLTAEARIARPLGAVAVGPGADAPEAAERLIANGVRALLSFGLAGGLDPALRPGALLVPRVVLHGGETFSADPALRSALGDGAAGPLLATDEPIAGAGYKAVLHRSTGAVAVDMESGWVALVAARHGLPFAVLRAVCDPADCTLTPVALAGFGAQGGLAIGRLLAALLREPSALQALLALARNASTASRSLQRRVGHIQKRRHRSGSTSEGINTDVGHIAK